MKTLLAGLMSVLLAGGAHAAAKEALLLIHENQHYAVIETDGTTSTEVVRLGDQVSYGESARAFAFASNTKSQGTTWLLDVLDKKTRQVVSSQPIQGDLLTQLSGPAKEVVLTDSAAYFITIRYAADRSSFIQNAKGGMFDFNVLRLSDGHLQTFALPTDFVNPSVAELEGVPIVSSWEGHSVWKFNTAMNALEPILGPAELSTVTKAERSASAARRVPQDTFAAFVVVPRVGVFRVNRLGEMQKVLTPSLAREQTGAAATAVGKGRGKRIVEAPNLLRIYPATYNGSPAIGALRKREEKTYLSYLDPATRDVLWQWPVSSGVLPQSVFAAPDGASYYVDWDAGTLTEVTKTKGARELWKLNASRADLFETRILAIGEQK